MSKKGSINQQNTGKTTMNDKKKTTAFALMQRADEFVNASIYSDVIMDHELEVHINMWLRQSEDKIDSYLYIIREAKTRQAQYKDEIKRLKEAAARCDKTINHVKTYAKGVLMAQVRLNGWDEGRKIVGDYGQAYLTKTRTMQIEDEAAMLEAVQHNPEFLRIKKELDKTRIKEAVELRGRGLLPEDAKQHVEIVERTSVVIK